MCDVRDAAALFGARDYRYLENPLDRQAEQASLLFEIVGVVDVVVQYRRKKRRPFVSRGEGRLPKSIEASTDLVGEHVEEELLPRLECFGRDHNEMCCIISPEAIYPRHVGEWVDGVASLVEVAFVLRMPALVLGEAFDLGDHRGRIATRLDERAAHVVERREVRCRGDARIESIGEGDVFP